MKNMTCSNRDRRIDPNILFFPMRKKCKKKKEILNHAGERSRKKEERNKNREKGASAQRRLIELKNNRGHLENR